MGEKRLSKNISVSEGASKKQVLTEEQKIRLREKLQESMDATITIASAQTVVVGAVVDSHQRILKPLESEEFFQSLLQSGKTEDEARDLMARMKIELHKNDDKFLAAKVRGIVAKHKFLIEDRDNVPDMFKDFDVVAVYHHNIFSNNYEIENIYIAFTESETLVVFLKRECCNDKLVKVSQDIDEDIKKKICLDLSKIPELGNISILQVSTKNVDTLYLE